MHFRFAPRLVLSAAIIGFVPMGVTAAQGSQDDNTAYGTTAAEFLLLGANARGTALGGSYVAVATDVGGLNANPAATALMTRPGAQFSQYNYVADTKFSWGAIAFPFGGGARAFGIQVGTYGFSDQPVYTAAAPEGTGEFYSVSQTFAGLTFAQNFSDRFSVGFTAKMVSDQLGEASGTAFGVDFGTHFHSNLSGKPIRFAFTLSNLGTKLSYDGDGIRFNGARDRMPGDEDSELTEDAQPSLYRTTAFSLPTVFRVGLAYDVVSSSSSRVTVMGEFNQPSGNKAGFGAGAELAAMRLGGSGFGIAARGSYTMVPAAKYDTDFFGVSAETEGSVGLALGAGINYQTSGFSLGFDYAWKQMGLLGDTNFFTVSLGW